MILRIFWSSVILGLLNCGTASADPIVVRAGEHDGFTRLVLLLPEGTSWTMESSSGKKTIDLSGHLDGFDTARVFGVVPRNRLRDLSSSASSINLMLGCECEVKAFMEAGNYLVLDVLDGPPLQVNEQIQASELEFDRPQLFGYGELLWSGRDPEQSFEKRQREDPEQSEADSSDQQGEALSSLNSQLIESIGRAASRGILEIAPGEANPEPEEIAKEIDAEIFDSSDSIPLQPPLPKNNIRITNSRDAPHGAATPELSSLGETCPSPDTVDLPSWNSSEDVNQSISEIRANLFSDLGRLDEAAAEELGKTYLYFGFGAEARQALSLSEPLLQKSGVLLDLVEIFENGYTRNPRVLHRFADCDSDFALWSILAARELDPGQPVNVPAALRGLARQPDHLRSFLAPALGDRLLQIGNTEAAAHALRNSGPIGDMFEQDSTITEARLSRATGNTEAADEKINKLAVSGAPDSPSALIDTINETFKGGGSLAPELALLAQAYSVELRNTDLGSKMTEANILAAAMTGQFEIAFAELEKTKPDISPASYAKQLSNIFLAVEKGLNDVDFLETVFDHFPHEGDSLHPDAVFNIANRLVSLGFPEFAMQVLSDDRPESMPDREKMLAAKAMMDLGRGQESLEYLEGINDGLSLGMHARAAEMVGNSDEATALYADAQEEQSALEASWLSENWLELLPPDAPIFGELRDIATTQMPVPTLNPSALTQSQSLLLETETTRETIERLLNELSKPANEPP